MGRYAQAKRRGTASPTVSELPAPVLVADQPVNLIWTWDLPDPDEWHIQIAGSADGPWVPLVTIGGGERTYDTVEGGAWYRVAGTSDEGETFTTGFSNPVHLDGL